ncbi:thioredoxin [Aggregicoccus sp. 17bor-14]|nr:MULTISPECIES: thioredoxin domain-containing protein [Myxococcaceae]MBF5042689.1 thioredoxin domain-containing protein [Simulacricoccus sp. 17bor-14]MRI88457.1 thioredoxin [Aggregicoccus sp. 17bor-14]
MLPQTLFQMPRAQVFSLALTTLLAAAGCSKATPPAVRDTPPAPAAAAASGSAAPAPASSSSDGQGDGTGGAGPLASYPGMDFSSLPADAQRELATVLSDEFCYCGCPHSLGACLKEHAPCRHAKREARLAASLVKEGVPGTEAIVALSRYYASFRAPRVPLQVDERLCQGSKSAPVTMVEFADFECPSCGAAHPRLSAFMKKNGDKVRFCYAPYPLPMHPNALPAAQAALWARDQGKFWELHDVLFENQTALGPDNLPKLVQKVGLNPAELQKVLKAGTYLKELEGFKALGASANIRGTPSLFFNGRPYELGYAEDQLRQSAEDEAEWRANNGAWAAD